MANTGNTNTSADATSQAQAGSAERERKNNKPENSDEIQFFDGTITKLVDRKNDETGETETVEVISDNLYPGERLKRADDEEKAAKKAEQARKDAKRAAEQRGTDK